MLHGFSVPLTPQGNSALASPPPWHYSSDCIVVEYWTDPAAVAAPLPPGLTVRLFLLVVIKECRKSCRPESRRCSPTAAA